MSHRWKEKLAVLVAVIGLLLLSACEFSQPRADWLEGDWFSEEWAVTYRFDEEDGVWTISTGQELVAQKARLQQKEGEWLLVDQDGTQFHILRQSDGRMDFQQVAAEGLMGTTASVAFEKVNK